MYYDSLWKVFLYKKRGTVLYSLSHPFIAWLSIRPSPIIAMSMHSSKRLYRWNVGSTCKQRWCHYLIPGQLRRTACRLASPGYRCSVDAVSIHCWCYTDAYSISPRVLPRAVNVMQRLTDMPPRYSILRMMHGQFAGQLYQAASQPAAQIQTCPFNEDGGPVAMFSDCLMWGDRVA